MPNIQGETYLVGRQDFRTFFVTIRQNDNTSARVEGFASIEAARAWIRERRDGAGLPAQVFAPAAYGNQPDQMIA